MTKTVKGAGRGRYAANKARHDQRTPFPARDIQEEYLRILRETLHPEEEETEGSASTRCEV